MRRLLLLCTIAVLGGAPVCAQPLDSLLAASPPELPFSGPEAFYAWYSALDPMPPEGGALPIGSPDGALAYYVIGADSSVWIQNPDGKTYRGDAFMLWQLGPFVGQRVGLDDRDYEGVGYGYEDGRLYVDLVQSAPVLTALAALGLLVGGGVWAIVWLRAALARSREQERRLAESRRLLADSREEERMRLARDLHDGPLQDIQALRMHLGMAERRARRTSARGGVEASAALDQSAWAVVSRTQDELVRVGGELRDISEGLRPPVLGSFGLAAAVRALAERHRTAHPGLTIDLDFESDGKDLDEGVGLVLYRIVQEATNNALQHGGATRIGVHYQRAGEGRASLVVEDDGAGFAVPESLHDFEAEGHLGVAGMAERADSIGGTLQITSRPGHTRVQARVPLLTSRETLS